MDAYIVHPTPDKLQVTVHNQYDAPESLSPSSVLPSPLDQFRAWFTEIQGKVLEPESMTLCTSTASGIPSARVVLFKQLDPFGFVFYTNYTSRKSGELAENPRAALVFYWREVHRQVRVVGRVERVSREESEAYYQSRPVGSRLGAWASKQSTIVGEGEVHKKVEEMKEKFGVSDEGQPADIPLPDFWGGWRVVPEYVLMTFLTISTYDRTQSLMIHFVYFAVRLNFGWASHLDFMIACDTSALGRPTTTSRSGR